MQYLHPQIPSALGSGSIIEEVAQVSGEANNKRYPFRLDSKEPVFSSPLLPPVIFVLFCLIIVSLFFITAILDIGRTQNTLLDVFENKGKTIIESVEILAQNKLKEFMAVTGRAENSFIDVEAIEEGFRIQEVVLNSLLDTAKTLEHRLEEFSSEPTQTSEFEIRENILGIIVTDNEGSIQSASTPIPQGMGKHIRSLIDSGGAVALNFYARDDKGEIFPIVGVKKERSAGMIFLMLNREGLKYRASKVAFQEAVEERGWRKGVYYFAVLDTSGNLLAAGGDISFVSIQEADKTKPDAPGREGRRILDGSPRLLEVFAPVRLEGIQIGTAQVAMDTEEVFRLKERNQRHIFLSALLMMTALVAAAFLFYRLQGRHAKKIQEMRKRLAQAERLSSLGRIAAGFAHEIRNPLNAVSIAIQRIAREFAPAESLNKDEFMNILGVVREEIRRLNRIIEEFVSPARERHPDFKQGKIADVLNRVLILVKELAESRGIEIEFYWDDPEAVVMMDASMMHQALLNLMKNAVESIEGRGKVSVSCVSPRSDHLVIMIKDTGAGIAEKDTERIFDFEYTTKEKGLGLGLPIAREIIQAHGGKISVESVPGKGTVFQIILPLR